MDLMAGWTNLTKIGLAVNLLNHFFINFNFENDRLALADINDIVINNTKVVATSGTLEVSNSCIIKNSKISFIEFNFANSYFIVVMKTSISNCLESSIDKSLLFFN